MLMQRRSAKPQSNHTHFTHSLKHTLGTEEILFLRLRREDNEMMDGREGKETGGEETSPREEAKEETIPFPSQFVQSFPVPK